MDLSGIKLELYAVINNEGKWFRAKGLHGYGENWVDDIQQAKIYTRIGPARSIVTFYGKFNTLEVPRLIKITSTNIEALDETTRVIKAIDSKVKQEAQRKVNQQKRLVDEAERKLKEAKKNLDNLKK